MIVSLHRGTQNRAQNTRILSIGNPQKVTPILRNPKHYIPLYNQGVVLCTLRVCTLGFGSVNHGIWPLIRVFGTQSPGLQILRVQT